MRQKVSFVKLQKTILNAETTRSTWRQKGGVSSTRGGVEKNISIE